MKKPMTIMLIGLAILFGAVFALKMVINHIIHNKIHEITSAKPYVSAAKANTTLWQHEIKVVGSSRTTKGVYVTTELGGMIREVYVKPGSYVEKGTLLAQLDIDPDVAKLRELEAQATVAAITYHRNQKQYKIGGVSKETVDRNEADFKGSAALVAEQQGIIAKKTIRAPFSGRLGICLVYPGQFLNPGDKIVALETLKPIYIDFYLPQQEIPRIEIDQPVTVGLDTYPEHDFIGKITTINPIVDSNIRNVEVEATLENEDEKILPGMFVYVHIKTGKPTPYITLPQMAVSFNPYGAVVFKLTKTNEKSKGLTVWRAQQSFVETGESRGNQISILKGIKPGEVIVTSGQLKIKNGSLVVLNNSIQPPNDAHPKVEGES